MATAEQILNLVYDDPAEIGRWVGFADLTEMHSGWIRQMLFGSDDWTLQAHRGSYKTSVVSLYFALHILLRPNESVIYMRKSDQNVRDIARQTLNILQSGAFDSMCRTIYGRPLAIRVASGSEIDTDLHTAVGGAAQLSGYGINSSITGRHADIVVTDDIVTLKDRVSHAEREHTKAVYQELHNIVNRGGRILSIGTPWHKDDAFTLMPAPEKWDCYHTGLIAPDKLRTIRASMTPSLFAANYELKHIASEDALFSDPQWCTADRTESIYGGKMHIDAAYGGSDWTACTVLKRQADGTYIGYGATWQEHVDQCMAEIVGIHERLRAGTIYCETNADKGYLAKEIRTQASLPVATYQEHENKFLKIATYLKRDWAKIRWLPDTSPEYLDQILDYTEDAEHDDCPDSAASLLRALDKGSVTIARKPTYL